MPPTSGLSQAGEISAADADCDVTIKHPAFGAEIVHYLGLQGFCKVGTGFDTELLKQAITEAQTLEDFHPPPQILVDGLLGGEGSAEIAEFDRPDAEVEDETSDSTRPTLKQMDGFLSFVATQIDPVLNDMMGLECGQRSLGLLHKASRMADEGPELNEVTAGKWLSIFKRQKIMLLLFLAPKGGTLSLKPFDDESEEEVVTVRFGQMIALRADALSHIFTGNGDSDLVLSCWLMPPERSQAMGGWLNGRHSMVPVARAILEWSHRQLMFIKAMHAEMQGTLEEMEIPRGWKLLASHTCYKGVQVALRGAATKLPNRNDNLAELYSTLSAGVDFGSEWPFQRFVPEVPMVYSPEPDCWKTNRTLYNIKHGTFMEGSELFDNKFFNMSVLEAKVTDPNQRLVLEGAYEALFQCGYVKKSLMQTFIGVYQGHTASDWDKVPHEQAGGFAGSYSPTIASNRVNFSLGIMGPSFTIDVEGASSSSALYQACHDVVPQADFRKPLVVAGLAGGVTINLSTYWWPVHNQFMNPVGRCLTFDQSAGGYIKGEGCCQAVVKRHADMVEGEVVVDDSKANIAIIAGFAMSNSGGAAGLSAPSGPAKMRCAAECNRNAMISPLDIDAVETDGKGSFLHDATEVSCISKVLRGLPGGDAEVLSFLSSKTMLGFCQETAGIGAFFATVAYQTQGITPGNIHLKSLNPHCETQDAAAIVPTEALAFRCSSSFVSSMSYGFGGTNVNITSWVEKQQEVAERNLAAKAGPMPAMQRVPFAFWPGGGGELDMVMPSKGYSILGSWTEWGTPEKMRPEGEGTYGFTVTLGENRFESFQILLDGDTDEVLHPYEQGMWANSTVYGPVPQSECDNCYWTVDGRDSIVPGVQTMPGEEGSGNELEVVGYKESLEWTEVGSRDTGFPGDMYHVTLKMAGKWKTVTWDKVTTEEDRDEKNAPSGKYYISGNWSDELLPMVPGGKPGLWTYEYASESKGFINFVIVRNKDQTQTFYPSLEDPSYVEGPEAGSEQSWVVKVAANTKTLIEFTRTVTGEEDTKMLNWNAGPGRLGM